MLPNILKRFTNERVVAIVDPPRAGLRKYFIIYVALIFNFIIVYIFFSDAKVVQALR